MQSYEWLFVPWLIYQFLYSLLMLIGPIVIIYVGFEAVDKNHILLGLIPIIMVKSIKNYYLRTYFPGIFLTFSLGFNVIILMDSCQNIF